MTATPLHRFGLLLFVSLVAGLVTADARGQGKGLSRFDWSADGPTFGKRFKPPYEIAGRTLTATTDGVDVVFTPGRFDGPVAVQSESAVFGDFQVEVTFDIPTLPDAIKSGYGVGVGVRANAGKAIGEVNAARVVIPEAGQRWSAGRDTPKPDGKTHYAIARTTATGRSGRLGLRRTGSEVAMLAADTPDGELRVFYRYPFTDQPVRIALFGTTGGAEVELRAKFTALRLRTGDEMPPAPPVLSANAALAADARPAVRVRSTRWLLPTGVLFGFVFGVIIGRVWRPTAAVPDSEDGVLPPPPRPAVARPPVPAGRPHPRPSADHRSEHP